MIACNIPPAGWHCTRKAGHDGPCAAWPDAATTDASPVGVGRQADEPNDPTRAEAVAWRWKCRGAWYVHTAEPVFAPRDLPYITDLQPLYAAPPSTEEGGGLPLIEVRASDQCPGEWAVDVNGLCVTLEPDEDEANDTAKLIRQALARDGGKTA